jgi:hypothetical protein
LWPRLAALSLVIEACGRPDGGQPNSPLPPALRHQLSLGGVDAHHHALERVGSRMVRSTDIEAAGTRRLLLPTKI